ncbi:MAG: NAD(P)-dependent oxidoreductase [Phycisphaerales bacterium]|nr:MAG: NAD(P)-dependent oxidoreductase [Phycisphaerales bacterium]
MKIAVTGATGFLGRYIVNHLVDAGHECRCWFRQSSDRGGFDGHEQSIEWVPGALGDEVSCRRLTGGADAVVHAALFRPGPGFRGAEGDLRTFVDVNVTGAIQLIESARAAGVWRFIFISTCAVHEEILDDRRLDEAHPMWPRSHYGAHKAAIEEFVYSFGLGDGYDICALRPTGIYGVARPIARSKWYTLVQAVKRGDPIATDKGGKQVHASDVAKAVGILLRADGIRGQAYNCYDAYVADQDVAAIARRITGSESQINKLNRGPKHQIDTSKLRALGMTFGGRELLEATVCRLVEAT